MRLKVEINTREHFTVDGYQRHPFAIQSRWFKEIVRSRPTPWRNCLHQAEGFVSKEKRRDLFDFWLGLTEGKADASRIIHIFKHYMENEGQTIDSMNYEKNLQEKNEASGFPDGFESPAAR
jgi:hypothetical protein